MISIVCIVYKLCISVKILFCIAQFTCIFHHRACTHFHVLSYIIISQLYGGVYMFGENNEYYNNDDNCEQNSIESCQTHVHEFLGSTRLAEEGEERHNHRFAGVTSEAIPFGDSHIHTLLTNTDFYEDHHHEVGMVTGPVISVGGGRHVHFVRGATTIVDEHFHNYIFSTLIQNPIGE